MPQYIMSMIPLTRPKMAEDPTGRKNRARQQSNPEWGGKPFG